MSVARSGQRPVLARDDPLDIFGDQRQHTLPVATADRREEIFHGLGVLLGAQGFSPFPSRQIVLDPIACVVISRT